MPQYEDAKTVRSGGVELALGVVRPVRHEYLGIIAPTVSALGVGLIKTARQVGVLRVRTAPLTAVAFILSAFIRPRPGKAMRVLGLSWYVHDPTGVASVTPFAPANLRTLTNTQARYLQVARLDTGEGPQDGLDAAEIVSGAGVNLAEVGNDPPHGSDYQHGFGRLGAWAASAGPFQLPVQTLAQHWPEGGVVLDNSPDASDAPAIAVDYERTALLADEDELFVSVLFTSAPSGMVPPL